MALEVTANLNLPKRLVRKQSGQKLLPSPPVTPPFVAVLIVSLHLHFKQRLEGRCLSEESVSAG